MSDFSIKSAISTYSSCETTELQRKIEPIATGSRVALEYPDCTLGVSVDVSSERMQLVDSDRDLEVFYAELNARLHERVYTPIFEAKKLQK